MDTQTIDKQYEQLQTEFQDVANTIQALAAKLQSAADGGDQNAREYLLDLKQVALDVKDEQMQVNNLLQAIHTYVESQAQQLEQSQAAQQGPLYTQPQPGIGPGAGLFPGRAGGMFGGFLGGGFGQAMKMGAGIGLGETLINDIFN